MSIRTPFYANQHQYNNKTDEEETMNARPGQIYLKNYNKLTQQNQQIIKSIHELKNKNQEISYKIEEKIKASRQHLERQSSTNHLKSTKNKEDDISKEAITPDKYLHNKFYRKESPLTRASIQQQINSNDKLKNELKYFEKEAVKRKERNNSAYCIIKQSHLKSLDQLKKQSNQKQNKITPKKKIVFEENLQSTPQPNRISEKYFVKTNQTKQAETPLKKTQKNLVYLPLPKDYRQQLVERYNKKISDLKQPETPQRMPKDNSPYRASLKRSQKQNSVYFLESHYKETDIDDQGKEFNNKQAKRRYN